MHYLVLVCKNTKKFRDRHKRMWEIYLIKIISGVLFFTLSPSSSPRPGLQLEEQEQQGSVGLHFAADGLHGCREQVAHGLVGDAHLLFYLGV